MTATTSSAFIHDFQENYFNKDSDINKALTDYSCDYIYHYTDIRGLYGILESRKLFFTSFARGKANI